MYVRQAQPAINRKIYFGTHEVFFLADIIELILSSIPRAMERRLVDANNMWITMLSKLIDRYNGEYHFSSLLSFLIG